MGGMCAGSLVLPRLVSIRRHPLRVYALLELGIGAIGLVVFFGMPFVEHVYARYAGHGPAGILLRGAVAGVCLLPPTRLMGATLPAIARWVETSPLGVSWLGFFYGGNIAGAVFGCLLAGFYLLRVHDRALASYVAVLFGQVEPTVIDVDELPRRLDRPDHQLVKQSLREVGFGEIKTVITGVAVVPDEGIDLLATYAGQAPFLKEWSRGAQINTDRNLRLQYLAGMWLNSNLGERILSSILAYYRFPDQTFVGSPEVIDALKQALVEEGRKASVARD